MRLLYSMLQYVCDKLSVHLSDNTVVTPMLRQFLVRAYLLSCSSQC